ncbi:MAG TPA: glutamate racemase [Candidatus Onthocola stercorigallinarum]|nr:glutamate racemase [Candidatus Onthocola stercorigallinarum]
MIGIIDSGIGGVTIFREILKSIPKGRFIYYSDSINNPYGDKSKKEILDILDNVVTKLIDMGCTIIVIACNTASSIGVSYLREKYRKILFIATEPAYKMVHDYNPQGKTLVMATRGTIESEKFLELYHKYDNHNTILLSCIGLAELIENNQDVRKYLNELLGKYKDIDNVVLGCTHYPLIKSEIKKILGDVTFYDGSKGVTKELLRVLKMHNIKYESDELKIKFIDSSQNEFKEKRFWKLLK